MNNYTQLILEKKPKIVLDKIMPFKKKLTGIKKNESGFLKKYFSEDYYEARDKFRTAVHSKKLEHSSYFIQGDLTIDTAMHRNGSDKLLIIVSGVHGVEGYAGSALQLLFLDKVFENYKNSFDVLMIHAYNPYGFKHNRRVNENNVDLNRNCMTDYTRREIDKKIHELFLKNKKLFCPEKPRKNKIIETSKHSITLAKFLIQHGLSSTIRAGSQGQNLYPKGVGYAGQNEELSTKIFKELVEKYTGDYKKTILLDLHTGLGRRNIISLYSESPPSANEFRLIRKTVKELRSRKAKKFDALSHSGAITEFFYEESKSEKKTAIILEVGTVSRVAPKLSLAKLSKANLEENQITHFGPAHRLEKAREKLRRAYYPNAKGHRKVVLEKGEKFFHNFCSQIHLL